MSRLSHEHAEETTGHRGCKRFDLERGPGIRFNSTIKTHLEVTWNKYTGNCNRRDPSVDCEATATSPLVLRRVCIVGVTSIFLLLAFPMTFPFPASNIEDKLCK